MARLPRLVVPGLPHLLIQRGHNGCAPFLDDEDRSAFVRALAAGAGASHVAIHAFRLLPTEVRLLVSPPDARALAVLMQSVGRSYVRGFNLRHGRRSTPWEGRFRSTVLEPSTFFLPCLRLLEAAAAEGTAFATTQPAIWSSAPHHLGERVVPWLTEHAMFWSLGNTPFEREAAYRLQLAQPLAPELALTIEKAAMSGWGLGSAAFLDQVAQLAGRRSRPLPPGRPRSRSRSNAPAGGDKYVPH